jgi:sterol-4alpha-carboxylate 3-dehydrogenase (decarboxylating)
VSPFLTAKPQAQAEKLVLAANRAPEAPKLLTLSIRPASLFGPGDVQMMPAMINVYHTGKTGFQLGDNDNLFDFTYVDNVAHSHLLGARALLATAELGTRPLDHERVDGEAFFITNGSPVYFWDFARMVWRTCGSTKGTEHVWTIGKDFGLTLAAFMEWGYWIVGKTPKLTRRSVKYSCMTRYYDIGKARRLLGYAPIVGLQEGIERSVAWFEEEARKEGEKKGQ